MCGIAGAVDLAGRRAPHPSVLRRMADAIIHRGPDDDGYLELPHLGLAAERVDNLVLRGMQIIGQDCSAIKTKETVAR